MDIRNLLEEKSKEAWSIYLPGISIDCVVCCFHQGVLKVLLTRVRDQELWGLPGGYVKKEENLKEAASRILEERTGAQNIYLQQFKAFGEPNRSEVFFSDYDHTLWHKQRFISMGFYALADYSQVRLIIDEYCDA